jgi:hypothetical protein
MAAVGPNHHHIGGCDIAMKDAAFVSGLERISHLDRQATRIRLGDRSAERFTVQVFEDKVVRSDVVDLAKLRRHPLDRDGSVQPQILRLVDNAHASGADERFDFVRAAQGVQ